MFACSYVNGCDGQGATCDNANCKTAFHKPDDTTVQVACQVPNVSGLVANCAVRSRLDI